MIPIEISNRKKGIFIHLKELFLEGTVVLLIYERLLMIYIPLYFYNLKIKYFKNYVIL